MTCTLTTPPVATILAKHFTDAEQQRAKAHEAPGPAEGEPRLQTPFERFTAAKDRHMAIDRPFGQLIYALIRASQPAVVVEFGTSFGISTIFLAAAVRDNGVGKVVTTEFIAEKIVTARQNLTDAGLADLIEFRGGDAMQTLAEPLPGPVDFLFLDGEKSMYLHILTLLEPRMKPGCLVVSDNTDHAGTEPYLEYIRAAGSHYISSALLTTGGPKHESATKSRCVFDHRVHPAGPPGL